MAIQDLKLEEDEEVRELRQLIKDKEERSDELYEQIRLIQDQMGEFEAREAGRIQKRVEDDEGQLLNLVEEKEKRIEELTNVLRECTATNDDELESDEIQGIKEAIQKATQQSDNLMERLEREGDLHRKITEEEQEKTKKVTEKNHEQIQEHLNEKSMIQNEIRDLKVREAKRIQELEMEDGLGKKRDQKERLLAAEQEHSDNFVDFDPNAADSSDEDHASNRKMRAIEEAELPEVLEEQSRNDDPDRNLEKEFAGEFETYKKIGQDMIESDRKHRDIQLSVDRIERKLTRQQGNLHILQQKYQTAAAEQCQREEAQQLETDIGKIKQSIHAT